MATGDFEVRFVGCDWPRFPQVTDLRYRVLHEPFGVERDDDWHDDDPESRHLVAVAKVCGVADGPVVGYARLILRGTEAQIRQVAVEPGWQGSGVGRELMRTLVRQADQEGATDIWLNARVPAIGFYERLGFEAGGETFNTGRTRLPHRRMVYRGPAARR